MNEIKIPEGHKATILGGVIRIEPIEEVKEPKFNRGDIVYDRMSNSWSRVVIYDRYDESNSSIPIVCKAILNIHDGGIRYNVNVCPDRFRIATTEEQQLLFDALAKEGKYWDVETLEIKDIPKEEIIKNIFRELRGHNISVNEAYIRMHKLIPING